LKSSFEVCFTIGKFLNGLAHKDTHIISLANELDLNNKNQICTEMILLENDIYTKNLALLSN